nr:JmjC domain-containing protein [Tanacetum cinerariifolium]
MGGDFHTSPSRSSRAPPAGQPSGGTEDPITLTTLSSVVSTLVQKTKKRKMVVSDSDQEDVRQQDVDLDALRALANATMTVDSNIPSGGKSPMVEEDIPVKARTFKQMEEDRLGEEASRRLHDEEIAHLERKRAKVQRKRQQDVIDSAMYYNEADWLNIRAQVESNASLSKTLLGDDMFEDNSSARMAALIKRKRQALTEQLAKKRQNRPMTQAQQKSYMRHYVKNQSCAIYNTGWTMAYVKSFTDDQLKYEFDKIRKVQSNSQPQAFSRSLKRTGSVLE